MIERTTIISFETGNTNERAEMFTSSPSLIAAMDALTVQNLDCHVTDVFHDLDGQITGKQYSLPRNMIDIAGVKR